MTRVNNRPRHQKLAAVMAAEMSGLTEAERITGIPKTTIDYWMDRPEFVEFRTKAREELAEAIRTVAALAWQRVAEGLIAGTFEPRDILFAAEKSTSLMQLLSGHPTERVESVTGSMSDHEREQLREVLRRAIADSERVEA
jgi:DNA-binding MarR family transcriptional regulator